MYEKEGKDKSWLLSNIEQTKKYIASINNDISVFSSVNLSQCRMISLRDTYLNGGIDHLPQTEFRNISQRLQTLSPFLRQQISNMYS